MPASATTKTPLRSHGGLLMLGAALLASSLLTACATPPTDPEARAAFEEANDPFEPANRKIFDVNLALDDNIFQPVAKAYRKVPEPVRTGVHNMMKAVDSPDLFANEVAQGEIDDAADTVLRMVINLTAGLGGFFDVAASHGDLPAHDTDFGITLGKWGVGSGPYLMLPVFGPSNPRDVAGKIVDNFADPIGYFTTFPEDAGRTVLEGVDLRERNLDPLEEIRRTSVDFYATLRSLYQQRRAAQIRGEQPGGIPAPAISELPNGGGAAAAQPAETSAIQASSSSSSPKP
ncbi:MAG TPA: VacJ family lipoprotein [Alphaproteobacteria bacterium]|nr:VacJ family lipoprotein [Alphaproteobacteria bacterium]